MKKQIAAYLILLFVLTNIFHPAFQPGDDGIQPMGIWEMEWIY